MINFRLCRLYAIFINWTAISCLFCGRQVRRLHYFCQLNLIFDRMFTSVVPPSHSRTNCYPYRGSKAVDSVRGSSIWLWLFERCQCVRIFSSQLFVSSNRMQCIRFKCRFSIVDISRSTLHTSLLSPFYLFRVFSCAFAFYSPLRIRIVDIQFMANMLTQTSSCAQTTTVHA